MLFIPACFGEYHVLVNSSFSVVTLRYFTAINWRQQCIYNQHFYSVTNKKNQTPKLKEAYAIVKVSWFVRDFSYVLVFSSVLHLFSSSLMFVCVFVCGRELNLLAAGSPPHLLKSLSSSLLLRYS